MSIVSGIMRPSASAGAGTLERMIRAVYGGGPSASGIDVNTKSAMQAGAVYSCVLVLSQSLAQLPLHLYEQKGRIKERATDHPLYSLLHDQPNEWMTSYEMKQFVMVCLLLRGNSVWLKTQLPGQSRIRELIPIQPDLIEGIQQDERYRLSYKVRRPLTGEIDEIPGEKVLHFRGLSTNGFVGLNPIEYAREMIGLSLATEKHGAKLFSNGARLGGILQYPGKLSQEAYERLKNSFSDVYAGVENAHKTALLEEGGTWEKITMTAEDSQFLESRKYQRSEIAGFFRVPPHMIGDLEKATFCLPAESEVFTLSGPKKICQVTKGEGVWSWDGARYVPSNVLRSEETGSDEILEIRTTNRTIRANARHRILARRKYSAPKPGAGGYQSVEWVTEYVPAGELKNGDTIVTLDCLPDTGKLTKVGERNITTGFMEFCGLLLGDGNVNKGQGVTIARADSALYMDHYRDVMRKEFVSFRQNGNGRVRQGILTDAVKLREGNRQTRFSSVVVAEELTAIGLSGKARTKKVPKWVFETSHEMILAFLRGYLDADGSVDKKGRISYHSVNPFMLSQVRHLCMATGIPVTNFRRQVVNTTLPNGKPFSGEVYTFTCSDPGSNLRIWSHDPRYQERLRDGVPFGRKGRSYPRHGGKGFDNEGCGLSRIVEIKKIGKAVVYDLEVKKTHSFIADGVVVHNSNIEHQDLGFVKHSLMPWAVSYEQTCKKDLMTDEDKKKYYFKFNIEGLLRGDIKSRNEAHSKAVLGGWLSPNEIREMEDRNPYDGGDEYRVQMNTEPVGGKDDESKETTEN